MLTLALPETVRQPAQGAAKRTLRRWRALPVFVALAGLLLLAGSAIAAAPATVTVRVEAFNGVTLVPQTQVTTNLTPIEAGGSTCSGTSAGGALYDAVAGNWRVKYDGGELGYEIDGIAGLNFPPFGEPEDYAYWAFWLNNGFAHHGACSEELTQGARVVFVAQCFATGPECPNANAPEHFLTSSAPSSSAIQAGGTVSVAIGSVSTASGEPEGIPNGVTVSAGGISVAPNAQGVATLTLATAGTYTVQAHAPASVPSDPYSVCVHNGNDGNCGTGLEAIPMPRSPNAGPTAAIARVAGIKSGHAYLRRNAPRILRGVVEVPAGGTLRDVQIRLERRHARRCFYFSGSRVRFVRTRRCRPAPFFSVGGSQSFSYLLPAGLPRGRYVYDIEAISDDGTTTKLVDGVSHVVFRVR
jgi:hypothetical protein